MDIDPKDSPTSTVFTASPTSAVIMASTEDAIPKASVSRIVITEIGGFAVYTKTSIDFSQMFSELDPGMKGRDVKAVILVVQGDRSLLEQESIKRWMDVEKDARLLVHEYLAQAGGRYWKLRSRHRSDDAETSSSYWARPVAQTLQHKKRAERIAAGMAFTSEDREYVNYTPLGARHTKVSLWPSTQFQPSHFLSGTEDENLVCYAAEERAFIYNAPYLLSSCGPVACVVFVDPLRRFQISHMKSDGKSGFAPEIVRWSRFFVGESTPEENAAVCNSVKADLLEVDSETRFFEALQRQWEREDAQMKVAVPERELNGMAHARVRRAVDAMMADDISHVTHRIAWALDGIESRLHDDCTLTHSTRRWRKELGAWRNLLANLSKELGDGPGPRSPELVRVREKVDRTSRRVDAAFDALVGSITLKVLERGGKAES